jgi:hypothetical protein
MMRSTDRLKAVVATAGIRWLLAMAACCLPGGLREARGQAPPSKEYQVKAACLLNFVQFI